MFCTTNLNSRAARLLIQPFVGKIPKALLWEILQISFLHLPFIQLAAKLAF